MPRSAICLISSSARIDLAGVEAGIDLVEHQQPCGLHRQALGQFQPLAAGQRQRRRGAVGKRGKAGEIEGARMALSLAAPIVATPPANSAPPATLSNTRHARKRLHDLEGARNAAARDLERRCAGHMRSPRYRISPALSAMHAGDQIDQRGLAGAVRADQPDDLAGVELERSRR